MACLGSIPCDVLGNWAAALTAFAAIIALVVGAKTIIATRRATAVALYDSVLLVAIDKPWISSWDAIEARLTKTRAREDYIAYRWYVSRLLFALEEILTITRTIFFQYAKAWRAAASSQIGRHSPYLKSKVFQEHEKHSYSARFARLIDMDIAGAPLTRFDFDTLGWSQ